MQTAHILDTHMARSCLRAEADLSCHGIMLDSCHAVRSRRSQATTVHQLPGSGMAQPPAGCAGWGLLGALTMWAAWLTRAWSPAYQPSPIPWSGSSCTEESYVSHQLHLSFGLHADTSWRLPGRVWLLVGHLSEKSLHTCSVQVHPLQRVGSTPGCAWGHTLEADI